MIVVRCLVCFLVYCGVLFGVSRLLMVDCCWLLLVFVVCCWLLVGGVCLLVVVYRVLFVDCCLLCVVCCFLLDVCCFLLFRV